LPTADPLGVLLGKHCPVTVGSTDSFTLTFHSLIAYICFSYCKTTIAIQLTESYFLTQTTSASTTQPHTAAPPRRLQLLRAMGFDKCYDQRGTPRLYLMFHEGREASADAQ
jgi:hypothetical protein